MKQSDEFMIGEADAWYERNKNTLGGNDLVSPMIADLKLHPKLIVEIGCSTGWRLKKLKETYGCDVHGIEPSLHAIRIARRNGIQCSRLTADHLPYGLSGKADLVIYGFCLYLVDPIDWLRIAEEGDRILAPGGHLVINDFYGNGRLFARPYAHREGLLSYHFDFSKLWLGNPLYTVVSRHVAPDDEMIVILKKLPANTIEVCS